MPTRLPIFQNLTKHSLNIFASDLPTATPSRCLIWVAVGKCAGAYGACMTSRYNTRPLAAEVMVDKDKTHLIRRRETIDEMLATESILPG